VTVVKEQPLPVRLFERIGEPFERLITDVGALVQFGGGILYWMFRRPWRHKLLLQQAEFIGFGSVFIVFLAGLFTGMVFCFQSLQALRKFGAEDLVGSMVVISLARELAPVITSLMVAGRAGSSMATEIGTMRVTEQIDAMATMAVNPVQYLVVPRVLAGVLVLPCLTMVFDCSGFFGAYLVATGREGLDPGVFLEQTYYLLDPPDFAEGLIKATVFGAIIAWVSCYKGYITSGGARGVGLAATKAVVISSVSVLIVDYFLTEMINPLLYGYLRFAA
jgi:phospholipid/cholesterol/gamma-HCH transport system permease protein